MQRVFSILLLCLVVSLPAVAEEISLKDGSKIVGHMTTLTPDKVEVETPYGKVQVRRSDIVTINFPENSPSSVPESTAARADAPKVDESLEGARYLNRTGKFSLVVPQEWIINPDIRRAPGKLSRQNAVPHGCAGGIPRLSGKLQRADHTCGAKKFFEL
jgi:hypothetical protein